MGSKAPPTTWTAAAEGMAGKASDQPLAPSGSRANALLRQIAEALQLPASALFDPPNQRLVVTDRGDGTAPAATDLSAEGATVLRAYTSIRDPAERHRLLKLLQEAAEKA